MQFKNHENWYSGRGYEEPNFAEFKPKERKNSKFIEFLGMKMSTIIDKI